MTNAQFKAMAKLMKNNKMGVDDVTDKINWWMGDDLPKINVQEMTNYLIKTEPMPDEVEKALIEMFSLDEAKVTEEEIAHNQISMYELGVDF